MEESREVKKILNRRHPPLLSNASWNETQNPSETSIVFGESFASTPATQHFSHVFQRYTKTKEAERINFTRNDEEPYNTPFIEEKIPPRTDNH